MSKSIVLGPNAGQTVAVPGHTITYKVVSADTNGAFSVLEVDLFGDGPPRHIHKTEDETFYILEGEVTILVGERTIRAAAGSFVLIPKGTVHAMARSGPEPAKFLAMYSPAGMEQFFNEAAGLDLTDTDAYVAKAEELAEKYNMEVVGPPLES